MEEPALRTGGLPLLDPATAWPECPRCSLPLLFRAQVPLALTSLVSFEDERVLLLFECHADPADDGVQACDGTRALLVHGPLAPREPPPAQSCDVILRSVGPRPAEVERIVRVLSDWPWLGPVEVPRRLASGLPPSIARETRRALEEVGADALVRPTAPTTLAAVHGGRVVPFDDGPRSLHRTTLPPLHDLARRSTGTVMRGLLGGPTPGSGDQPHRCACDRPTRTAARLVSVRDPDPSGARLGVSVTQVCLRCDRAVAHRRP